MNSVEEGKLMNRKRIKLKDGIRSIGKNLKESGNGRLKSLKSARKEQSLKGMFWKNLKPNKESGKNSKEIDKRSF